ncbi:restriction endonuclease subunit S [Sulfurimonas sp. SAG-AH-194-I05]|nr:restriction endonuclease subunit S [Sulfurimonas sp. SAG-AH-194-I05]MDF1875794.1 restriction endonuclease subunit S [Sulfurimonas sp. SAG-AH-194-I05]
MSSKFTNVRLGDCCSKIGSGSTPRGGSNVYLESGEYALFRSQNIYNNGFATNGLVYITAEAATKLKNVTILEDDILLNITGDSVARVCIAPSEFLPARVNQHVAIIRTDSLELNSKYTRYYLSSSYMQKNMLSLASVGATRNALTKVMIEDFMIPKPPLQIQQKIADILSTLDEKIELNRKMNQTLEEMAQTLFKSWFVDFDPVHAKAGCKSDAELEKAATELGISKEILDLFPSELEENEMGMIPKGWAVKVLSDVIDFQNGYSFKSKELHKDIINSTKVFKMGHIHRGGGFKEEGKDTYFYNMNPERMNKYLLKQGDILMAMTDMKANMALLAHTALMPHTNRYLLNQRAGRLRVKDSSILNYPYVYIFSNHPSTIQDLRSRSNSGVQVNLTTIAILDTKIIVPAPNIHVIFDEMVLSLFNKLFVNNKEIINLQKTRDTLLPKLLSGEVEV